MNHQRNQPATVVPKGKESTLTYMTRRAVLTLGATAILYPAGHVVLDSVRGWSGSTLADNLAQPYNKDQVAVKRGEFKPGSVVEVSLPSGVSAGVDAANIAGGNSIADAQADIMKDIIAQEGTLPGPGARVYLDASEVAPNVETIDQSKT